MGAERLRPRHGRLKDDRQDGQAEDPEDVGDRMAKQPRSEAVGEGVAGDHRWVGQGEGDRAGARQGQASGRKRQAQHSAGDQRDAGPSAGAYMLAEPKRTCNSNNQRRGTPHQRVDDAHVTRPAGGCNQGERGEIEDARDDAIRSARRGRNGQERQRDHAQDGRARRHQHGVHEVQDGLDHGEPRQAAPQAPRSSSCQPPQSRQNHVKGRCITVAVEPITLAK